MVVIDRSAPIPVQKGQTAFDLPPGQHHLLVYIGPTSDLPFERYGQVTFVALVHAGQATTVYYRAPALKWVAAAIGLTPHRVTPGRGQRALILVAVGALILVPLLAALLQL